MSNVDILIELDATSSMDAVQILRASNPDMLAIDIAKLLDISRERVRQILVASNLPTDPTKYKERTTPYTCIDCGKNVGSRHTRTKRCKACYLKDHAASVVVNCNWCGKSKTIHKSTYETTMSHKYGYKGRFFCNRHCLGKHLGTNYGFKARPDNIKGAK
jgi:hypothetical protein